MNGLTPEQWTGEACLSWGEGLPALVIPADGEGSGPEWLSALPYAAALMSWDQGAIRFWNWNGLFTRSFSCMADTEHRCVEPWKLHFIEEFAVFAEGEEESRQFELERMTPLGIEVFACNLSYIRGARPGEANILLSTVDRTADRKVEENLRRELISDTLTALPNRIGFGEEVETMIEQNAGVDNGCVGILIIDLLRFSRVNEALGSMVGDELILAVAARLKSCVGRSVPVSRLGGNEFGICYMVPGGITDLVEFAKRIKKVIGRPIRLSDLEISVDCAIGCSLTGATPVDADELIRQAQTALRSAKATDRLEIYRAGELGAARQRFLLESHLRDTLAKGGLHLVYQPIIDMQTFSVTGFEALARWDDPEIGSVPPDEFIPVAEESGLVVKLGRWALHEAMQQLNRWDEQLGETVPIKMNVNLSPIQMARDDVIRMINDALRLTGVSGHRLMIELTESAIVTDPDNCRHLLEALRRADVAIAMDDFGTGYSNMASLQRMPIDLLKIDRSFVSGMLEDSDKLAIIRAILSLSEALGLKTTAEGIESEDVALTLRDMGCSFGQGYYFARPMRADAAYDFWLAHRDCPIQRVAIA